MKTINVINEIMPIIVPQEWLSPFSIGNNNETKSDSSFFINI